VDISQDGTGNSNRSGSLIVSASSCCKRSEFVRCREAGSGRAELYSTYSEHGSIPDDDARSVVFSQKRR
jgi:hypothetical protein